MEFVKKYMESFTGDDVLWNHKFELISLGLISLGMFIFLRKKRPFVSKTTAGQDVVILHQFPRAHCVPNLSSFCVKLETFLRMANIPYRNKIGFEMSPKGKCPWIDYKGEIVSDSQFAIEHLNKDLGIDLNKKLSLKDRGVARAVLKMCEENLYRAVGLWRWCEDPSSETLTKAFPGLPFFVRWNISREVKNAANKHGIGLHSSAEIQHIAKQDLLAISNILGTNKFLFGEDPCEIDCAVFGQLAQIRYAAPGSVYEIYMKEELANLWLYCENMKQAFWPDWHELTSKKN